MRPSRTWYLDENIKKQKLIKVKIKPTVTNFIVGSKTYLPGDIVKVPEANFSPDFMEKIEVKPKPKPKPKVIPSSIAIRTPAIVKKVRKAKKIRRAKKK